MIADIHRNLLKGGIYLYPPTKQNPQGKLRLLYECNPMAFLIEQAGGKAINENQSIMDIKPEELHQRTAFYAGSSEMIKELEAILNR